MEDRQVLRHIDELVAQEHALRESAEPLDDGQRRQLAAIEEDLDQAWDLLRQRRARREAGQDPQQAQPRPASTVEDYDQ